MKKNVLSFSAILLLAGAAHAQIVGNAVYLKGQYVEVGIDGDGGFEGADTVAYPAPAGMHCRSNTQYLGFVANPQMDGWVNYDGDFFTPGSPENGWGIEIIDNSGTVNLHASNNRNTFVAPFDIPGAITGYTSIGGVHTATWQGNFVSGVYDLDITIEYTLYDTAHTYTTTVSFSNNGDDIDELYYYRNIDPDNNVTLTSDYSTTNTIISQPSGLSNLAAVKAEQLLPWYSSYTLSANDSSVRVCYGGFSNRDASDMWNGTGGLTGTPSSVHFGDEAIALACRMDSLLSFRATNAFTFSTSFGGGMVTGVSALEEEGLSVYPNPTYGTLNILSAETVNEVLVYNTAGVLLFRAGNVSTVDLSAYDAGIYFVKVKTSKANLTQKIVKQ